MAHRVMPGLERQVRFSEDRRYRYWLRRSWALDHTLPVPATATPPAARTVVFLMLNPSVADEQGEDPTVAKCVRYARAWGFTALEVVNVFALVSTDPAGLHAVADPVGPANDATILEACRGADLVVGAWGNDGMILDRHAAVLRLLGHGLPDGVNVHALQVNKNGTPKHPLYCSGKLVPVPLP